MSDGTHLPAKRDETRVAKRRRKLYRDPENGKIAGVCEGLGNYFGIDPVWVRIVWAAAMLGWGVGLAPYIIAWIAMPEGSPEPEPEPERGPEDVPPELVEAWKEVNDITEGR